MSSKDKHLKNDNIKELYAYKLESLENIQENIFYHNTTSVMLECLNRKLPEKNWKYIKDYQAETKTKAEKP